jgi:hypothetical protein
METYRGEVEVLPPPEKVSSRKVKVTELKIRSLNLSSFWVEECSEIKYEIFAQLKTRLRNRATEHHIGILTTNPDLNKLPCSSKTALIVWKPLT